MQCSGWKDPCHGKFCVCVSKMLIQDGVKLWKWVSDDTANVDLSSPALRGISTSASQKKVFVDYETWTAQAGMPILQAKAFKVTIEKLYFCEHGVRLLSTHLKMKGLLSLKQITKKPFQFWKQLLVIFLGIFGDHVHLRLNKTARQRLTKRLIACKLRWMGKRMNCGHMWQLGCVAGRT